MTTHHPTRSRTPSTSQAFFPSKKRANSGAARWCTTAKPTVEMRKVCRWSGRRSKIEAIDALVFRSASLINLHTGKRRPAYVSVTTLLSAQLDYNSTCSLPLHSFFLKKELVAITFISSLSNFSHSVKPDNLFPRTLSTCLSKGTMTFFSVTTECVHDSYIKVSLVYRCTIATKQLWIQLNVAGTAGCARATTSAHDS